MKKRDLSPFREMGTDPENAKWGQTPKMFNFSAASGLGGQALTREIRETLFEDILRGRR